MAKHVFSKTFFVLSIVFTISCNSGQQENKLSDQEQKEGWILLFNGKSLDGWHLYREGDTKSVWQVKEGELSCNPKNGKEHGDLLTNEEFENFDLTFEWKMGDDGNSGVFINVLEMDSIPATWFSGPEYQLLGNANPDYPVANERSGCLFGLSVQKTPVAIKPVGEWNQSRIKQVNGKVEFYLNGVLTTEEDFKSPSWFDKIKQSGFKDHPEFGKSTKGHIALQDWAKGISFRNIKIKKL